MTGVTVTVRFRGHYASMVGKDSIVVRLEPPAAGSARASAHARRHAPTLEDLLSKLSGLLPNEEARQAVRGAAIFADGRLLGPETPLEDGLTLHILSPLAGG